MRVLETSCLTTTEADTNKMERVVVVGTTGSGKSTLGLQLAQKFNYPYIEMDALHWGANWTPVPDECFRERMMQATDEPCWVAAGNYRKVRDIVWSRADTLIWLDYPLYLNLWRLFKRSIQRIRTQEDLWGTGNYETWRAQFFSRDSLFIWALQTYNRHRREYPQLIRQPQYAHLHLLRFTSHQQTYAWLRAQ